MSRLVIEHGKDAENLLIEFLSGSTSPAKKADIMRGFAKLRSTLPIPTMATCLYDDNPNLSPPAATTLVEIGGPTAIQTLELALANNPSNTSELETALRRT